jgi:predicted DNA-binding transcriptional regulator YafY
MRKMKIERLLGIVIYLLNRDIVNTNILAEKFEVSPRTIQRDIETLNLAGIPIISIQGMNGGYGIMDSFKLDKQITDAEDYQFIITALTGMNSAYNNKKLGTTLEKILNASKQEKVIDSKIKLDFSVSREGNNIDEYLKIIENSIDKEHMVEFEYTNSYGDKTLRAVESIGAIYKWYAWYMLGFCCDKKDYRLFKIARMRNLKGVDKPFSIRHESMDKILADQEKQDNNTYMNVKILCDKSVRVSVEEYFSNGKIAVQEDGDIILQFKVPANERAWKGLLFTYGNKINIIEPEELKEEFISKAKEIIEVYK